MHAVRDPVRGGGFLAGVIEELLNTDHRRLVFRGQFLYHGCACFDFPLHFHRALIGLVLVHEERFAEDELDLGVRSKRVAQQLIVGLRILVDRLRRLGDDRLRRIVHANEDAENVRLQVEGVFFSASLEFGDLVAPHTAVHEHETPLGKLCPNFSRDQERISAAGQLAAVAISAGVGDRVALKEDTRTFLRKPAICR